VFSIRFAETDSDLLAVLELQRINLRKNISPSKWAEEGFLTAVYDLDYLREMNQRTPFILSETQNQIAGYLLACDREHALKHPLLQDLVFQIEKTSFLGKPLHEIPYILIGQICIAKFARRQGLTARLYSAFRTQYSPSYELAITDVAEDNPGSIQAHEKIGFKTLNELYFEDRKYRMILWNWE